MKWGEAFARAIGASVASTVWTLLALALIIGGGIAILKGLEGYGSIIFLGAIIVLTGLVFLYLLQLAVMIKLIADVVNDVLWRYFSSRSPNMLQQGRLNEPPVTPPHVDIRP